MSNDNLNLVEWEDDGGYLHVGYQDEQGYKLEVEPPDLDSLDWGNIKKEIHNQLIKQRLLKWDDVQKAQNGALINIISRAIRRRLVVLYKIDSKEEA